MRAQTMALAGAAVLLIAGACGAGAPTGGTPSAGAPGGATTQAPDPGGVAPSPNTTFSGSLEAGPGISGDISFTISEAGQITQMKLDGGLASFDCGGGKTIVDSGTTTYFFPDPITIAGGRFSVSRGNPLPLDWDGVFDSPTSVHGTIRLSGGSDCANRPTSVGWSATSR
jgi:hypothetical protein